MTIFELNIKKIDEAKEQLINHSLFRLNHLQTLDDVRLFMSHHVYAVWDFMSLTKSLQNTITSTITPWIPKRKYPTHLVRFINDIVLCEESDITPVKDEYMSHFDLYLTAMNEINCDTKSVLNFIDTCEAKYSNFNLYEVMISSRIPAPAADFMKATFDVIATGKPHMIAAYFAFGRETVIPTMFKYILQQLNINNNSAPYFHFYLERHIEVDGEEHGNWSLELVEALCEGHPLKLREAEEAAITAINARIKLWDSLTELLS